MYLLVLWLSFISSSQLAEAKMLIAQERYSDAVIILKSMNDSRARYYEGWCFMQLGDCEQANPQFQNFIATYTGEGASTWKEEAIVNMGNCGSTILPSDDPVDTTLEDGPNEDLDVVTTVSIWPEEKGDLLLPIITTVPIKIWPLDKQGLHAGVTPIEFIDIKIWPENNHNTLMSTPVQPTEIQIWPYTKPGLLLPYERSSEDIAIWPQETTGLIPYHIERANPKKWPPRKRGIHIEAIISVGAPIKVWPSEKQKKLWTYSTVEKVNIWPPHKEGVQLVNPESIKGREEIVKVVPKQAVKTRTVKDLTKTKVKKTAEVNENGSEIVGDKISEKQHHFRILFNVEKQANKSFVNLASIGPVSSVETKSGYHLYYIGFYNKRESAEKSLKKIIAKGYKAAEVVEFGKNPTGQKGN